MTITAKDLFSNQRKLTFLVGAGCSIDPPSCLPSGREMIEALINYSCDESEIDEILKLKNLRFEQLIEIISNRLDPHLKIIGYYGICDKPNLQHFFLAEMIKRGHFVMTTNFDYLIEYALLQMGVDKNDIVPVITQNDFERYNNPSDLLKQKKKTIYKLHGSIKNIITNQDTRNSLVATIQSLALNKDGFSIFDIQNFQKKAILNLVNDRTLVIIGYSGSDDFDIIPTLKKLENLRQLIWINHSEQTNPVEKIIEINEMNNEPRSILSTLLKEIKIAAKIDKIYRIDTNTTQLIGNLIEKKPNFDSNFNVNLNKWLRENIPEPTNLMKYYITYEIYKTFNKFDDMLRCSREILLKGSKEWKASALINIGRIFQEKCEFSKALEKFKGAYEIDKELRNEKGKAIALNNIGRTYQIKGQLSEALEKFEEAYEIDIKLEYVKGQANRLNNIGLIYHKQKNYQKALERYFEASKIFGQLGDLKSKATTLNNIGMIYQVIEDNTKAVKFLTESLEIHIQINNIKGKAICLINLSDIHKTQKNYKEALKYSEEALEIFEQLENPEKIANCLYNIGVNLFELGKKSEALHIFEEAIQNLDKIGMNNSPEAKHIKKSIEKAKSKMN